MNERKNCFKEALISTMPVMAGYIVLGIGFGMLLQTRGYGVGWAFLMSLIIFAGSMQYVAIDLMTGGVSLITAALTTLAVNARHLFYGISMVDKYKAEKKPLKKYFLFWTLTDETYSLVCSNENEKYHFYVSSLNYSYWVLGSVLGSLLGEVIPFSMEGIDFSLTALFLTVFVEQWLTTKNHVSALVGVGASLLCLLLFGSEQFLIPAMVLIAVLLILLRKRRALQMNKVHSMLLIIVISAVTMLLRFLPFWIFGNGQKTPAVIQYLGKVLPYAIMGMLVVFCLKGVSLVSAPHGLPELIACATVVGLHIWRRNTAISIVGGTVIYMVLVQLVW